MKRILKASAALMLGSSLILSACSGNTASTDQVQKPDDPESVSGSITVWAWALEADFLETMVPEFNEKYPNIEVNINKQGPDQVYQRLITGLAAGEGGQLPDLVQVEDQRLPSFQNDFPNTFVNLSESGFEEHMGSFTPTKEESIKDEEGNVIAFPRDVGPVGVFYRKDIFEEAGVEAESIETWSDYVEAGETIKDETGADMLGLTLNESVPLNRFMIHQQDAFYFNSDGELTVGSEETRRAADLMKEFEDKDIMSNVTNWDGRVAGLKNGEVATLPNAVWWYGTMVDQMPELSGSWGMFPLPEFEEQGVRAANSGGSSYAIPQVSDQKEAAYLFGEFVSTNLDAQLAGLENQGLFPSLTEAYDAPIFQEGQEYFDGQSVYADFAEIATEIPEVTYTSDYARADNTFNEEIVSMYLYDEDPEDVVDRIEQRLKAGTGRDVAETDEE